MTPTIAPTAIITLISPCPDALLFVAAEVDAAAAAELLAPAAPPVVVAAADADEPALSDGAALPLAGALDDVLFKRLEKEGNCTGGLAALQIPWATV